MTALPVTRAITTTRPTLATDAMRMISTKPQIPITACSNSPRIVPLATPKQHGCRPLSITIQFTRLPERISPLQMIAMPATTGITAIRPTPVMAATAQIMYKPRTQITHR